MSTKLINEQTPLAKQQVNFDLKNQSEIVGDMSLVDLEFNRLKIWNNSDKLMRIGKYYGDDIVKPPFSLYFEMPISNIKILNPHTEELETETLCLKISTTLRRCEFGRPHYKTSARQTPYTFWLNSHWQKHRKCFIHLSPLELLMLTLIYEGQ